MSEQVPVKASCDEIRASFLAPVGEFDADAREISLGAILRRSARRFASRPAIAFDDVTWTYDEFDHVVSQLAAGLLGIGLQPGDRIALMARNSHWFAALRFAVARAGMVFVPINFMLSVDDTAYILSHCEPALLISDQSTYAAAAEAAVRVGVERTYRIPGLAELETADMCPSITSLMHSLVNADGLPSVESRQIAQIIYTSGTEARPKGAMLTHEAVLSQVQSCIIENGWVSGCVQLNAMPLFHCAQLDAFLTPSLQIGGSNIIIASPDAEKILALIEQHRVTHFFAPPTIWIALLRSERFDAHDLSSLTNGYYGASIMPLEVLKEMQRRLPALGLYNLYGQTEITCVASSLKPVDQVRKAGSAGLPVIHVETRIVDDDMRDVASGEVGEIVHRSPQLLTGYWRDTAKTREAFVGGWFHSGDLGTMDEEGYITVVDRKKDVVKSGGENVSSREVEDVIYLLDAVAEAAVVGIPHDRWIEAVAAIIVRKADMALSDDEVMEHCGRHLSRFKIPKLVVFLDALPRNASGKILKRDLRELADKASNRT